jgi:DNA-binding transcriptional ArsR family regulator
MATSSIWYAALRRALAQAADEPDLVKRAERAARIQRDLAQGSEEAAAVYRRAIEKLKESEMSYGQISAALAIARGTVQGHAEHSRRAGLVPGLIFAFRDKDGDWYPDRPEAILPGGPYATGDSIKIRGDRPSWPCQADLAPLSTLIWPHLGSGER